MEPLKFLSVDDVQAMHEATMRIMQEVGILWTHKPSLDILTDAGCTIKNKRVCFPPDLVLDSVAKANKRPKIRGRNGTVNEIGGMSSMREQARITPPRKKIVSTPRACSMRSPTATTSRRFSRRLMCRTK
jgi:trimethylamine--corrinoid protein Co-methyltransferase